MRAEKWEELRLFVDVCRSVVISYNWDNYDFEKCINFCFKIKKHIVKKLIMIKLKE